MTGVQDVVDGDADGNPDVAGPDPHDEATSDSVADAGAASVAPDTAMARFEDVSMAYGDVHALGPLTHALEGNCIGLLGPNGAGKTTMIRLLMGLLTPTSGTVTVLGRPVQGRDVQRRIGYVPEGEAAFPRMNGVQAVAYAGRLVGMPAGDAVQRAHQVLDYVGLQEARYRDVGNYSTGMRQRLKLAQALVHDPELLILDEPTEGVDPQAREHILGLLHELATEYGIRILLSTHLLSDVERMASHVIMLSQGRIVTAGPLEELRRAGSHGHMVRVAGDAGAFTARLAAQGVAWHAVTPDIHVELDDPGEVLAHVRAAGLVVRHLAPAQMRLEQAFEKAMGGTHA